MCPADSPTPPEAIRVWTCECGKYGTIRLGLHFRPNTGQVCDLEALTERVYVAVDREAWVERIAAAIPHHSFISEASWDACNDVQRARRRVAARAVVDALLGPEDDRAH